MPVVEAGLTAVSLAVTTILEGLPAVVKLTLGLGGGSGHDRGATLVRRLPADEALGSVDVVCTDKSAVLTEAQMAAARCR